MFLVSCPIIHKVPNLIPAVGTYINKELTAELNKDLLVFPVAYISSP
jgi:hypothetical protein